MNEFILHNQLWRYVSTVETFALMTVLAFYAVVRFRAFGVAYTIRLAGLTVVFGVAAYASGSALTRNLPPQDYNFFLAVAYTFALVAFVVPWDRLADRFNRQR